MEVALSNTSRTRELARFLVATNFEDVGVNVQRHAKLCILDWLGAALAGSVEPPSKIIRSVIRDLGGKRESTIIGAQDKTTCLNAALANGIAGHSIELDDVNQLAIIHPAAAVVPAALAVGERCDSSGREMIESVVLGYETEVRIGMAMNPSHYEYWHPTGTCGTFGAVAAASKLLDLNEEQTIHALGIAGTQASGLIETFGSMSKSLNPGRAAQSGVLAALLAQNGFTSTTQILDSKIGYCRAASKEPKLNLLTDQLGVRYAVMRTCFKYHASCGHTHGAIDALQSIALKHGITPEMVEQIIVETYPIAAKLVGNKTDPSTASEAKFSLHYCLAAALVCGKVGLEEFSEQRLKDHKLRELSKKVTVSVGEEFANAVLGSARVTVNDSRGRSVSMKVDEPKGYPDNPLTPDQLKHKFRRLASIAIPEGQADNIITAMDRLERVQVSELCSLL